MPSKGEPVSSRGEPVSSKGEPVSSKGEPVLPEIRMKYRIYMPPCLS